jgi:hypothetical protein
MASVRFLPFYFFTFLPLHHRCFSCRTENDGDDVTDYLKDLLNCFVHNRNVLNGELLGLLRGRSHLSFTLQSYKKYLRSPNIFREKFCDVADY